MNRTNLNNRPQRVLMALLAIQSLFWLFSASGALPDLTIYAPAINPHVVTRTFDANDCTVHEGCVQPGTRRLLAFTAQTRNLGADLVLGDPATNSLFYYDPCHNHYHYEGFGEYRLRDLNSNLVLVGHKIGFCVEDVLRWDSTVSVNTLYDCNYQGIQKGWADVYTEDVPCQWLDITGFPGGDYILEMEVNPEHSIPEASYANNIVQMPVTIPTECSPTLANDNFSNAQVIQSNPISFESYNACATKEPNEPNHAGNSGGHSIWYRITPPTNGIIRLSTEGSDFDTLLAVYRGTSVGSLSLLSGNDNINATNHQSALAFNGMAGTVYSIAVDGYNGASGKAVLNVNPPTNDAFASCRVLTGLSGSVAGYNIGATKQAGEPDHNGSFSWRSIWYCWSAPTNWPVVFDTRGSDFDTLLAIYTGSAVSALTRVASDNDSGGNLTSRAIFNAVKGVTYHVAVDGVQGGSGNVTLNWHLASRLVLGKISPTSMQLTLTGGPGTYQIQAATNLTSWSILTTVTVGATPQVYVDNAAGSSATRFYRAVQTSP